MSIVYKIQKISKQISKNLKLENYKYSNKNLNSFEMRGIHFSLMDETFIDQMIEKVENYYCLNDSNLSYSTESQNSCMSLLCSILQVIFDISNHHLL